MLMITIHHQDRQRITYSIATVQSLLNLECTWTTFIKVNDTEYSVRKDGEDLDAVTA